jgi:hypothetical protein
MCFVKFFNFIIIWTIYVPYKIYAAIFIIIIKSYNNHKIILLYNNYIILLIKINDIIN